MKKIFHSNRYYYILGGIFLLYTIDLIFSYLNIDLNFSFGYLDQQAHWQSTHDLWVGKVIYRDFIWEYGVFMLLVRLPIFLIFGQNYLSNLINNYFFLPALGIGLGFLTAKEFSNKKTLITVMLLAFLYHTVSDYNAVRHLVPELGLIMVMSGMIGGNNKKRLIGSALIGLSLTSSPEYALIGLACLVFFLTLSALNPKKGKLRPILETVGVPALIGGAYLFYLQANHTLSKALVFHSEHIKAFYSESPCREFFPRASSLQEIFLSPDGFIANFFYFLYRINLYVMPVVIIILTVFVFRNRRSKWFVADLTLLVYSVFAFARTINTPCYIHYGLMFVFILSAKYAFSEKIGKGRRYMSTAIVVWLLLASGYYATFRQIIGYFSKPQNAAQAYLPEAGISLNADNVAEYNYIIKYIKSHVAPDKYIFTYPDGPYNLLTGRESPVASYSTLYSSLAPSIEKYSLAEISAGKPEYIIINKLNSSSYKSAIHGVTYNVHAVGHDVYFQGITTSLEDYISRNYDLVEKREIAWILKRTNKTKSKKELYLETPLKNTWSARPINMSSRPMLFSDHSVFNITGANSQILLTNDLTGIAKVKIPVKIDLGSIKPFSKFVYQIGFITNSGLIYRYKADFVTSDWQDTIVEMPALDKGQSVTTIILTLTDNLGFLPWGKPVSFEMKTPTAYVLNPGIKIEDSINK